MRVDDDGGTAGASSGADAHAGASGGALFNATGYAARVFWTRTLIFPAFPCRTRHLCRAVLLPMWMSYKSTIHVVSKFPRRLLGSVLVLVDFAKAQEAGLF